MYTNLATLPDNVRSALDEQSQKQWMAAYNSSIQKSANGNHRRAVFDAWQIVKNNPDCRFFAGFVSSSRIDRQNDSVNAENAYNKIAKQIERGGTIVDTHSNRVVGSFFYAERRVTPSGHSGIYAYGAIMKGEPYFDSTWQAIKKAIECPTCKDVRKGYSIGGFALDTNVTCNGMQCHRDIIDLSIHEISVCQEPANPDAMIYEINTMAKSVSALEENGENMDTIKKMGGGLDPRASESMDMMTDDQMNQSAEQKAQAISGNDGQDPNAAGGLGGYMDGIDQEQADENSVPTVDEIKAFSKKIKNIDRIVREVQQIKQMLDQVGGQTQQVQQEAQQMQAQAQGGQPAAAAQQQQQVVEDPQQMPEGSSSEALDVQAEQEAEQPPVNKGIIDGAMDMVTKPLEGALDGNLEEVVDAPTETEKDTVKQGAPGGMPGDEGGMGGAGGAEDAAAEMPPIAASVSELNKFDVSAAKVANMGIKGANAGVGAMSSAVDLVRGKNPMAVAGVPGKVVGSIGSAVHDKAVKDMNARKEQQQNAQNTANTDKIVSAINNKNKAQDMDKQPNTDAVKVPGPVTNKSACSCMDSENHTSIKESKCPMDKKLYGDQNFNPHFLDNKKADKINIKGDGEMVDAPKIKGEKTAPEGPSFEIKEEKKLPENMFKNDVKISEDHLKDDMKEEDDIKRIASNMKKEDMEELDKAISILTKALERIGFKDYEGNKNKPVKVTEFADKQKQLAQQKNKVADKQFDSKVNELASVAKTDEEVEKCSMSQKQFKSKFAPSKGKNPSKGGKLRIKNMGKEGKKVLMKYDGSPAEVAEEAPLEGGKEGELVQEVEQVMEGELADNMTARELIELVIDFLEDNGIKVQIEPPVDNPQIEGVIQKEPSVADAPEITDDEVAELSKDPDAMAKAQAMGNWGMLMFKARFLESRLNLQKTDILKMVQ